MKDVNKYVGQFCVVETEQRQYVGLLSTVDIPTGSKTVGKKYEVGYTVLTGVAGRPPVFFVEDIDDITLVSTINKKEK